MATTEERAQTIRERMASDMSKVAGGSVMLPIGVAVDEAMFHVEHLLCEIEELREQAWRAQRLAHMEFGRELG